MSWRIEVGTACIASGMCLGAAAGHFAMGDDGRSHPLTELVEPDEPVRDAAALCPVEAIAITDAETGEPVDL